MIARHSQPCKHTDQDARYGVGFRVMNPASVKGKVSGYRCTVCCPPKEKGKRRGGIYDLSQLIVLRG